MNSAVGQYGDTTYTKVFVGGLAWETQKDTMKKYFEQFGEILEAVVITDKATGRSKGYGFVTFREPEGAMRACIDPTPVIDGRRANCNLAYLGLQRSKPSTPKQGVGRNWRVMSTAGYGGGRGAAFPTATAAFPHYAVQQGIPFSSLYGYSVYSPDYGYPTGYYGMYGGGGAVQYPMYGAGGGGRTGGAAFYPYSQYGEASGGTTYPTATGQSYQYQAHPLFHYSSSTYPSPHYASPVSLSLSAPPPSGMTMSLHAPMYASALEETSPQSYFGQSVVPKPI